MSRPTFADLKRWDYLIALGFGSGLAPKAPGTAGSLLGLVLFIPLHFTPVFLQVAVIVISLVGGIYICERVADDMSVKDPGVIVWDEFVGMWIAMLWLPDLLWLPVAFLLFRVFDILKPWPVSLADRELAGGAGIMLDDVVAGLYALAFLQLSSHALALL